MLVLAALPLGLALTLNEIYLRADTVIISLYRTDREVGLYGLAWRICELVALFPVVILEAGLPGALAVRGDRREQGAAAAAGGERRVLGDRAAAGRRGRRAGAGDHRAARAASGFEGAVEPLRLLLPAGALAYVNMLFG